jgi:hypothetical protein
MKRGLTIYSSQTQKTETEEGLPRKHCAVDYAGF